MGEEKKSLPEALLAMRKEIDSLPPAQTEEEREALRRFKELAEAMEKLGRSAEALKMSIDESQKQ